MGFVILLFGVLILLFAVAIVVKPDPIFSLIRNNSELLGLHALAVVVRLILGIALITYAAESKYPFALQVIGWLSITAAIILGIMGRSQFKSLITWGLNHVSSFGRLAGLLAIFLGGFLIYAVV